MSNEPVRIVQATLRSPALVAAARTDPGQDVLDGIALIRQMWKDRTATTEPDSSARGAASAAALTDNQSIDADIRKVADATPVSIAAIRA